MTTKSTRPALAAVALATLALGSPAQARQTASADEAAVRAAVADLARAFTHADGRSAEALVSADLKLIHPRRGEVDHDAFALSLSGLSIPEGGLTVTAQIESVVLEGNLAAVMITWITETASRQGPSEKDLEVWRRETDGRWRLLRGASYPLPGQPR